MIISRRYLDVWIDAEIVLLLLGRDQLVTRCCPAAAAGSRSVSHAFTGALAASRYIPSVT